MFGIDFSAADKGRGESVIQIWSGMGCEFGHPRRQPQFIHLRRRISCGQQKFGFQVPYNGEVMGLIGLEYKRLGLYVRSGYMGLQKEECVVPVLLRSSFALSRSGVEKHGSIYIEGGCGLQKSKPVSAVTGTGYVYRLRLSEKLALDMNGGLRISYSHPDVYDKYAERKVPKESLGLSNSLNIGLALTIALVF